MTTDELLAEIRRLGMEVVSTECGGLALRGGGKVSPKARAAIVAALKLPVHRDELARRLRPPPARRIVLIEGGRETVLREMAPGGDLAALAEEAAKRPGAVLWLQHWAVTATWGRWETFATTGPEDS